MADSHIQIYHRWRVYALTEGLTPNYWSLPGAVRWVLLSYVGKRMHALGMFYDLGKANGY